MKKQWVLKQALKKLAWKYEIIYGNSSWLCFTTNTTIFWIEKTGIVFDKSLAKMISEIFNIPFDELFKEECHENEVLNNWNRHLCEVYKKHPEMNSMYYLGFVTRYDGGKSCQAISPTYWLSDSGDSFEWRRIIKYYPDSIIEHLGKFDIKCAVIHNQMDLIYFYYGQDDEIQTAMLICTDIINELYLQMETEYLVEQKDLFDSCGFKDCVSIQLRLSKSIKKNNGNHWCTDK